MATEKRLIDANETINVFTNWLTSRYDGRLPRDVVAEIPTVDAVEVVRCKDCKWYSMAPYDNVPYCSHESGYCGEYMGSLFYCACGERKDNGED